MTKNGSNSENKRLKGKPLAAEAPEAHLRGGRLLSLQRPLLDHGIPESGTSVATAGAPFLVPGGENQATPLLYSHIFPN